LVNLHNFPNPLPFYPPPHGRAQLPSRAATVQAPVEQRGGIDIDIRTNSLSAREAAE